MALKMKELISVIVPVYNCEKYIEICIRSVLQQTYTNLELILVDDGSTDGSGKVCDQYVDQDTRVKVIHKENGGVSSARNRGIENAVGDWYSFVDADDFIDKDMYSILMMLQEKTKAEIVQCGYRRIENGQEAYSADSGQEYVLETEDALKYLIEGSLFGNALWTKLFSKKVIEGLWFDENLKINEDVLFNFNAFVRSEKIVYIDKAKYNYVVHSSSTCFTIENEKKLVDVCTVSKYMLQHLENSKIAGTARTRYVQMMILYFRFCYERYGYKNQTRDIAKEIWQQVSNRDIGSRSVILSSKLIHWCPHLYCHLHDFYAHIKKPKWS